MKKHLEVARDSLTASSDWPRFTAAQAEAHAQPLQPLQAEALDLLNDSFAKLDAAEPQALLHAARAALGADGQPREEIATRLDRLLTAKLEHVMGSTHLKRERLAALDDFIGRINRDVHRAHLDAMPQRFATRWTAFRDLIATALQLQLFREDASRRSESASASSAWHRVLDQVRAAGEEGLPWNDAAQALMAHEAGPNSRGGASQLITAMRAAGWIEAVTTGRTKRLFLGSKALAPSAVQSPAPRPDVAAPAPAAPASIGLVHRAVGVNKDALLEFQYFANERHKQLRLRLERSRHGADHHVAPLEEALRSLISVLDDRFAKASFANFDMLHEYFGSRSDVSPRVCIKGNLPNSATDSIRIGSIIRDAKVSYPGLSSVNENTAFKTVLETGRYYLNGDIARSAISGRYDNPRLRRDAIAQLRHSLGDGQELTVGRWLDCWSWGKGGVDPRSAYRSTLVLPLITRNPSLDEAPAFAYTKAGAGRRLEAERSIFGFLCLDHPDPGYFREDPDAAIAGVFADLLATYVYSVVALTLGSSTYQEAMDHIGRAKAAAIQNRVKRQLSETPLPLIQAARTARIVPLPDVLSEIG